MLPQSVLGAPPRAGRRHRRAAAAYIVDRLCRWSEGERRNHSVRSSVASWQLALPVKDSTVRLAMPSFKRGCVPKVLPQLLHCVHFTRRSFPHKLTWLPYPWRTSSRKKSWHELCGVSRPTQPPAPLASGSNTFVKQGHLAPPTPWSNTSPGY